MEKLTVYNKAHLLIKEVYILLRNHASLRKDFSLCDQIKRAGVSVVTNIAEGYNRSPKQFKNYLYFSSGSANEVVTLLQIVSNIYDFNTIKLQEEYKYLGKQIISLSRKIKS